MVNTVAAHIRASPNLNNDIRILSALMNFHTRNGDPLAAMSVWDDLVGRQVEIDVVGYLCVLAACSQLPSAVTSVKGELVYGYILQQYSGNSLIHDSKCSHTDVC